MTIGAQIADAMLRAVDRRVPAIEPARAAVVPVWPFEPEGGAETRCSALGHLDEQGNLFFTGRQSHWLRRRGENMSAYEIEAVLTRHAAVREAIETGFPSELGEDDVKAWIVPEGEPPSEVELIRWCLASLAAFKVPRYIAFVDDFPRSSTKREGSARR